MAILAALLGTVVLMGVGCKLPGLEFDNQKVEAAYRKELVLGEDDAARADSGHDTAPCGRCGGDVPRGVYGSDSNSDE